MQMTLISHSSGGSKFKVKVTADSVSGESLLPGPWKAIVSPCPHMVQINEGPFWGLYPKDTNPIHECSALMI